MIDSLSRADSLPSGQLLLRLKECNELVGCPSEELKPKRLVTAKLVFGS